MNIQSSINQLIGSAGTFGVLAMKYRADTAAAAAQKDTAEYTRKMHELNLANAEKKGAWLDARTEQTEAHTSEIMSRTHRANMKAMGKPQNYTVTPLEAMAMFQNKAATAIQQKEDFRQLYNGSAKDPKTGKFISVKEDK